MQHVVNVAEDHEICCLHPFALPSTRSGAELLRSTGDISACKIHAFDQIEGVGVDAREEVAEPLSSEFVCFFIKTQVFIILT
jgi:hypothetical protein